LNDVECSDIIHLALTFGSKARILLGSSVRCARAFSAAIVNIISESILEIQNCARKHDEYVLISPG
jgi:hypothetical protein